MMKPEPPATCFDSSSSSGVCCWRGWPGWPGRRGWLGLGRKNSDGSTNGWFRRRSLVLMTSVEVIETTAGITRDATSANDGMVTAATGPDVVWIGDDCAFELFIIPRSALSTTPKATEAMMIAIVDRMRLVDEFIGDLLL